jgi:Protein of unknown function (DUF2459)
MGEQSRHVRRLFRGFAIALLVPLGLYLGAAATLGRVPVNAGWTEPAEGITIFVQTNGVHAGLVLPDGPGRWRAFGWGDRDFYLNTPTWAELRPATVVAALAGSGKTVVHVDLLGEFAPDANWRPLRLRPAEYARLRAYIAATLVPGETAIPGYGPADRFYPARGRYSAVVTCNVWVGRGLARAGVRTGFWTPFESDVMRWVPLPRVPSSPLSSPRPAP